MFDLISGLPVHALVVHAVVVVLPLAALGTIAMAVRPAWRVRYGPLVVLAAAGGTALVPVATTSGEALAERVGKPKQHAELGETVLWFAVPLLVLSLALWLVERRRAGAPGPSGGPAGGVATSDRGGGPPPLVRHGVAVLASLAAIALTVQVVRVGDSGARVVWEPKVDTAPAVAPG